MQREKVEPIRQPRRHVDDTSQRLLSKRLRSAVMGNRRLLTVHFSALNLFVIILVPVCEGCDLPDRKSCVGTSTLSFRQAHMLHNSVHKVK